MKYPLPNLDDGNIKPSGDNETKLYYGENDKIPEITVNISPDSPKGWGNPWPDLPMPDDEHPDFDLTKIKLSNSVNPCAKLTILGYYMSWHIVGVSFKNENGREPHDGYELVRYNNNLPIENRYGIHVCCKSIEQYITKFKTDGIPANQKENYLEYCTYLTLIYVISHEWGHYRSEVMSFQLNRLTAAVTGAANSDFATSYLSYFVFKKQHPKSNFEEVFAEWASLKMGVFNYFIDKPNFANQISNWSQVEATVKFMLAEVISRPNRVKPYSDIRYWIDFKNLTSSEILARLSANNRSLNRSVNDNVNIEQIKFLKNGRMSDLLMHNQMQFSKKHVYNGTIVSAPLNYPYEPDSAFYLLGDDECLSTKAETTNPNKYITLGNPIFKTEQEKKLSKINKVIDGLKNNAYSTLILPIRVFPDLLPLDSVYFHT